MNFRRTWFLGFGLLGVSACGATAEPTCDDPAGCDNLSTGQAEGIYPTEAGPALDLPDDSVAPTCAEVELVATHMGCEFWAVDLPNAWLPSQPGYLDIAAEQPFAVVVTSPAGGPPVQVDVFLGKSEQAVDTALVEPGETHTFNLDQQNVDPMRGGKTRAYRIISDHPIAAYQFQPLGNHIPVYSNDATALFPRHALGDDYVAITGDATMLQMAPPGSHETSLYNAGAFVTIVATEDGTALKLHPAAGLLAGNDEQVVLARGDAYTVLSDLENPAGRPTGDLSGTRVIAGKPVAVFGGSVTTGVPIATDACCADHLEHQMLPLWAWGDSYLAAPPPSPADPSASAPALYRLIGTFPDTVLEWPAGQPDGAPATVQAGELHVFTTDKPFIVRSTSPDKSFALAQFLLSSELVDTSGSGLGDPAMVVLPATAQMQSEYTFLVPSGYVDNYVTAVTAADAIVTLDGEPLAVQQPLGTDGGVQYAYVRAPVDEGRHSLQSDKPLQITVIGYDSYVSYAYVGGSGVSRISELPPVP